MSTLANADNLSAAAVKQHLPNPSACRYCKYEKGSHGWTNSGGAGLHQYTEPTAEQRKERILASLELQRAARESSGRRA